MNTETYVKEFKKEMIEHPWADDDTVARIVMDHKKKKVKKRKRRAEMY